MLKGAQACPAHSATVLAVFQVSAPWSSWYCVFRTGQCRERQSGKCLLVHDPTAVAVCPRWLQGSCSNAACLLQHCRCPDVMPVCTFYLQVSFQHTGGQLRPPLHSPLGPPSPLPFPLGPPPTPPVSKPASPPEAFQACVFSCCAAACVWHALMEAQQPYSFHPGATPVSALDSSTSNSSQSFWCVLVGLVHDRRLPLCARQGGPKRTCMPGVCGRALPSWGSLHQEALDAPHDSPVAAEQGIAGKHTSF